MESEATPEADLVVLSNTDLSGVHSISFFLFFLFPFLLISVFSTSV